MSADQGSGGGGGLVRAAERDWREEGRRGVERGSGLKKPGRSPGSGAQGGAHALGPPRSGGNGGIGIEGGGPGEDRTASANSL